MTEKNKPITELIEELKADTDKEGAVILDQIAGHQQAIDKLLRFRSSVEVKRKKERDERDWSISA